MVIYIIYNISICSWNCTPKFFVSHIWNDHPPRSENDLTQVLSMKENPTITWKKTWKKNCKTSGNHTLPSKKHNNSRDITEYHRNSHWAAAAFGAHFKCSGISKPQSFSGKDNQPTWRTGPGRRPDSLAKWFFCGSNYSPTLPYASIAYLFIVQCRHRHHHHHHHHHHH